MKLVSLALLAGSAAAFAPSKTVSYFHSLNQDYDNRKAFVGFSDSSCEIMKCLLSQLRNGQTALTIVVRYFFSSG